MNPELIDITLQFLTRVTLSPAEIQAYNAVIGMLEKEKIQLSKQQEIPMSKPSEVESNGQ